jgi:hypothetical protein
MNWYGIWVLKAFGLAKQITIVRPDELDQKEMVVGSHINKTSVRHLQSSAGD